MKWLDTYKANEIKKIELDLKCTTENSPSKVFIDKLGGLWVDLITWGIIAVFVYIWWETRGQSVGCDRISVDLCNSCYGQAREIANGVGNNLLGGLIK